MQHVTSPLKSFKYSPISTQLKFSFFIKIDQAAMIYPSLLLWHQLTLLKLSFTFQQYQPICSCPKLDQVPLLCTPVILWAYVAWYTSVYLSLKWTVSSLREDTMSFFMLSPSSTETAIESENSANASRVNERSITGVGLFDY